MTTKKKEIPSKYILPRPMWYGVEKYTKYEAPHTVIKRFFREEKAKEWMEMEGRMPMIDDNGKTYRAFKSLYKMPWYWRPPMKKKAQAWLEENNPLMRYYWNVIDITGDVISKIGEGVLL